MRTLGFPGHPGRSGCLHFRVWRLRATADTTAQAGGVRALCRRSERRALEWYGRARADRSPVGRAAGRRSTPYEL